MFCNVFLLLEGRQEVLVKKDYMFQKILLEMLNV